VRFRATGLPWPLPVEIDEAVLETRLFTRGALPPSATRPVPDWATVHQELKRKGVTLQLLWAEYQEAASEPTRCYQYTQFCQLYHAWAGTLEPVLRQVHVAGERLFVDYMGPTMPVVDPRTGEIREAQVLCHSRFERTNLSYAAARSSGSSSCCSVQDRDVGCGVRVYHRGRGST